MKKLEIFPDRPYLILQVPSGVVYSTQAGCLYCNHPETEGYLIDIGAINDINSFCSMSDDFKTPKTITEINSILADHCSTGYKIFVDEDRLDEAMEAWLPVVMKKEPIVEYAGLETIQGFPNKIKAILIWENCD